MPREKLNRNAYFLGPLDRCGHLHAGQLVVGSALGMVDWQQMPPKSRLFAAAADRCFIDARDA